MYYAKLGKVSAPRASALWSPDDVAVLMVSALLTATVITGAHDTAELCHLSRAGELGLGKTFAKAFTKFATLARKLEISSKVAGFECESAEGTLAIGGGCQTLVTWAPDVHAGHWFQVCPPGKLLSRGISRPRRVRRGWTDR